MATHPYGLKLRRLGFRDLFRLSDLDLTSLPSPLPTFHKSDKSDLDSNPTGDGNGGGSGGHGGGDGGGGHDGGNNGQSKSNPDREDYQNGNGRDHGQKDTSDPSPSAGPFPCPANHSPNQPLPGCIAVNDGGPFFHYIGDWTVSSLDGNGKGSIHQATAPGAAVEISVDGTGFALFGIVPPSNATDLPPSALYTVDNATSNSTQSQLPFATECQRNQNFFQDYNLPPGNHTVTVNVTAASATAPYIVDYIWICSEKPATSSPDKHPPSSASVNPRSRDAVIVGSVLGSILLILAVTFLACCYIRRRRRRQNRLRGLHLAASPVASWLHSQSGSRETGTVFTSTESIMRRNPTYSSSADTKDLEKSRRDTVSIPPSVRFSSMTRPPSSQPLAARASVQHELASNERRDARLSSITVM